MWRSALGVVLAAVLAGCAGGHASTISCTSAPCPTYPHHWTARELARDVASVPFPAASDASDHLYGIVCRINAAGSRAACTGRRKHGPHPGDEVTLRALLRLNGSWSLLCWPDPSQICDPIQIREQRANPITE
jgi:hypothetical protein